MRPYKTKWISMALVAFFVIGFSSCSHSVYNAKRNKKEQQKQRSSAAKKKRTEYNIQR